MLSMKGKDSKLYIIKENETTILIQFSVKFEACIVKLLSQNNSERLVHNEININRLTFQYALAFTSIKPSSNAPYQGARSNVLLG